MILHTNIYKLIEQGEGLNLDFKFEISDSKKIARTLAAFANTEGGKLLVGIKDNGKIAGVRSEEEIYMIEGAANMYCKPEVKFSVNQHIIDRKAILEVSIEKSKNLHKAISEDGLWLVFIRVDDKTLPANKVFLEVLKRKNDIKPTFIKYSKSEKILIDYLSENETISLSKYCKIAHLTKPMAEEVLINLILMDIIDLIITEKQSFYKLKSF